MKVFWTALAGIHLLAGQSVDSSGSAALKGTYRFREVAIVNFDSAGKPAETAAAFGTIVFDGAGRYAVNGTVRDTAISNGAAQPLASYGSYAISASGSGRITNPLNPLDPSSLIYGAVGQGIFIGSSTEGMGNNLFIAIPAGAAADSAASYAIGLLDFSAPSNGVVQLSAQSAAGKTMFASADEKYALGWTPGGFDVLFGIKAASDPLRGVYYIAGLQNVPGSTDSCGAVNSFYGSLIADGAGNQIVHQRLASPLCYVMDFETDDRIVNDGSRFVAGAGGAVFMGIGTAGVLSLTIGVRADNLQGSGVFLHPLGVANAASFAPVTASIAPGEMIALSGSGLSPESKAIEGGQTFPKTLSGVRVVINGIDAPIYYVSPTQIAAIVPYATQIGPASIQVMNNGAASNMVTAFVAAAAPGIFTQQANGLGYAAAIHAATGAPVTAANPAMAGEYVALFATGLGTVTPGIAEGAVASLAAADHRITVRFDDYGNASFRNGKVTYAGLAPGLAGLYQVNVQVPAGVGPGDVYLEIAADGVDVNQVTIPIGKNE